MTRSLQICRICCLAGIALFPTRALAADAELEEPVEAMRVWRSSDGLPSDSVTAIIQTRDGFLWIGCTAGLARFDGVTFTNTDLLAQATNNPVRITALCEDTEGHLWVGAQQAGLFELAEGRVRHFTTRDGLLDDSITALAADSHGAVWVGSKLGLNLWTGNSFRSFTPRDGLPDALVSGVNVARSGTVWITTRVGMCQFVDGRIVPYELQTESQGRSPEYLGVYEDRRGNLWAFGDTYLINLTEGKRFNYFRSSQSASVRIWSLCEGKEGRLWIGTSGRGLYCFENTHFQPVVLSQSRWPYDVRAIYEDREGTLWLGTSGGGLVQLRPQSIHVLRAGQGLPAVPPTALAADLNGRIYVGLQRGGLFAGESGRFEPLTTSDGIEARSFVTGLCVARDGSVWAGTFGDGLFCWHNGRTAHFTTANGLADATILAVCPDEHDGIWAAAAASQMYRVTSNGVVRLDASQGLPRTAVTAMIPSAAGGHWLGTQDGKVWREREGKFTLVETSQAAESHPVLGLCEGQQDRLWIATGGGGLSCLTEGKQLNWRGTDRLPSDFLTGVAEDTGKNLWLVTSTGIYRTKWNDVAHALQDSRLSLACKLMSEAKTDADSLPGFGGPRVLQAPPGKLWFATSDGLLSADARPPESQPSVFPVYLESALLNGRRKVSLLNAGGWSSAPAATTLFKAPVDLRSLEIHFTALSFVAPAELQFRHKLEGSDADWVDDIDVRSARYGRLPYGRYRFRAAARAPDGTWQEASQSFAFLVPTPLYFQTWAVCLYVLASIALVAGIVRVVSHRRLRRALARLAQQESLERERMRIARDMHDEIGSKLTKISFLSEHAQVDATSLTGPLANKIESIAQTSRDLLKKMDEIVWAVNPRNDSVENLASYFSHYAGEYFQNTSIDCQLRLPQDIPHAPLSSEARHNLFLAFEEALNNALKHSGASTVTIDMKLNGSQSEIQIADNGKGFQPPPDSTGPPQVSAPRIGNGLKNMRQRLAAIGGECLVSSRVPGGTTVTLRFRLPKPSVN